jgi:uncharacterized protein
MIYLADTNIFLEILLDQEKRSLCEEFLSQNVSGTSISDFSLHSIGVILFRVGKESLYREFIADIIPSIKILSLPLDLLEHTITAKQNYGFDFDDACQYSLADYYGLKILTMDKDFSRIDTSMVVFL